MSPVDLAAAAGLFAGSVDVSLAVVSRSPALGNLADLVPPLAMSSLIVFALSLVLVLSSLVLRRGRFGPDHALPLALVTVITVFFLLFDYGHTAPFVRNPFRLLFAVGSALAAGGILLSRPAVGPRIAWVVTTLPLVLMVVMVFAWLFHYRAGASISPRGALTGASGAAAAAMLVVLLVRAPRAGVPLVRGLLVLVLASAGLALFAGREHSRTSRGSHLVRHVILVSIDALRADALSCYNAAAPATPNIDALAKESIRFERAISPAPWTLPAMAAMMTGVPATVHGAVGRFSRLPSAAVTLAERLRSAGYVTAAVVDNPVLSPSHGMDQGFDDYIHFPRTRRDPSLGTAILQRVFRNRYREESTTDVTVDLAAKWVERNAGADFFFWMHVIDPHSPYAPPGRFQPPGTPPERIGRRFADHEDVRVGRLRMTPEEKAWMRGLYEGEVRYVDDAIGGFVQKLRELRIYDDALVIVTSDHGEEFFDHGGVEHGHTLYNELLQVPLLIKLPRSRDRRVISDLVSTQRVAGTVMDACGVAAADDPAGVGGMTLLGPDSLSSAVVYSTAVVYHEPRESIYLGGYKYIRGIESITQELYDAEKDTHERNNLADDLPSVVARARFALDEHARWSERLTEILGTREGRRFKPDPEKIKQLKALGYL